jgi:uncharacterized protein YjbI with pentapeptide repeats
MAGPVRCDLTNRDFSNCSIPHAYLYKRDLSGCDFTNTNMDNCMLVNARLNESLFIGTRLHNIKYNKYTDCDAHVNGVI